MTDLATVDSGEKATTRRRSPPSVRQPKLVQGRECANWPVGKEFRILEPMSRITLNVILRAIFGAHAAQSADLNRLCEIVPPYMRLGQVMAFVPAPPTWAGRHGASATPDRSRRHGWRSAAEHAAASALISHSPKWTSCCRRCYSTALSRLTTPPTRSRIFVESPILPDVVPA